MNNYIVNESSANIKFLARQSLKGHWQRSMLAMLVFSICTTVPSMIFEFMFGGLTEEALMSETTETFTAATFVSSTYSILVTGAFTFGITVFFLDLVRERKADVGQIFAGFGYYFKTLGLMIVMSFFVFLWSLLLIVPGIIAAIRYSMAFFILADDPNKGIMQCIRESKEMMNGNKSKYFTLQLSFIGWYMLVIGVIYLVAIVAVVLVIMFPSDSFMIYGILIAIMMIMMIVAVVPLLPYIQTATTIFYEIANGNLRRAEEDKPAEPELPPLSQVEPEQLTAEEVPQIVIDTTKEDK